MDPSGTKKTTLPVTQRETLPGNPKTTTPGTPKNKGNPRSSTPIDIKLSSPGIYSSSYLSMSSNIMTPESLTPKTNVVTEIKKNHKVDKVVVIDNRKFPKADKEAKVPAT